MRLSAGIRSCAPSFTGLRLGEAAGLMWNNINFQKWTLNVQRTLDKIFFQYTDLLFKVVYLPLSYTGFNKLLHFFTEINCLQFAFLYIKYPFDPHYRK